MTDTRTQQPTLPEMESFAPPADPLLPSFVGYGTQLRAVAMLMRDGEWRTLHDIAGATEWPVPSISARLRDLRKPRFGGHTVERRSSNFGWEYRLVVRTEEP